MSPDDSKPTPPRPLAARLAGVCAALVVVTFFAFQGVFSSAFVDFDDDVYVSDNDHVRGGLDAESVAWAFTTKHQGNWHPLTWLSHMLDVEMFGLDAGKHHGTSLLLHAMNAVLLFLLLSRMTRALWRPALVAALFAVHPLHVESVAWVAERKDVLSTLFWFLTVAAWLRYLRTKSTARYGLVLLAYASGLMAKPMLVTLPFTLLLLDYWPLGRLSLRPEGTPRAWAGLVREKAPLFAMAAASCVVTVVAQRAGGAVQALQLLPFPERLANSALAYVGYLGKTLWPASLSVFYPHAHTGLFEWTVAGAALLMVAATVLALRIARRAPFVAVGWLWYVGTLIPVIGLVQVGGQAMADRYTYVPLIGVFVAAAWGLGELVARIPSARYVAAGAATVAIGALVFVSRAQVGVWADSVTLFRHAATVTSNNWMAYYKLGTVLTDAGRHDEAIEALGKAVRLTPDFAGAQLNLGNALARAGRLDEAIERFREALRLEPRSAVAAYNLGNALSEAGRLDEAVERYDDALRLDPTAPEAHANRANVLARQGRAAEAIAGYESALRLRPGYLAVLNNLGLVLIGENRLLEAIDRLQHAVRINPGFAQGHNSLGVALTRANRLPEAAEHFQRAVALAPNFEDARINLRRTRESLGLAP